MEDRASAKPRDHVVDRVVTVADGNHGALHADVHQVDDTQPISEAVTIATASIEHAVGADLGSFPSFRVCEGVAKTKGGIGDDAREVPDASVEGEVLALRVAL
jgi:hypothetical protein